MPYIPPLWGQKGYGRASAAAGTVINVLVEPMLNAYTAISKIKYLAQTAQHLITVMRPLGMTTTASAVSAGGTITLAWDPGVAASYVSTNSVTINGSVTPMTGLYYGRGRTGNNAIATSDYIVYQSADGGYNLTTVTMSGLVATPGTSVVTGGINAGAPIWFFGVAGDTNPVDNLANPVFTARIGGSSGAFRASDTTPVTIGSDVGDGIAGILQSFGKYEPLVVQSNNVTDLGYIEQVVAFYTNKPGPISY